MNLKTNVQWTPLTFSLYYFTLYFTKSYKICSFFISSSLPPSTTSCCSSQGFPLYKHNTSCPPPSLTLHITLPYWFPVFLPFCFLFPSSQLTPPPTSLTLHNPTLLVSWISPLLFPFSYFSADLPSFTLHITLPYSFPVFLLSCFLFPTYQLILFPHPAYNPTLLVFWISPLLFSISYFSADPPPLSLTLHTTLPYWFPVFLHSYSLFPTSQLTSPPSPCI